MSDFKERFEEIERGLRVRAERVAVRRASPRVIGSP